MKKTIFLAAMLLSVVSTSFADEPYWAMNIAAGFDFFGTTPREMDNIRAYRSSNQYLYGSHDKMAVSYYFSFMPEYYLLNQISVSTGLRLTNTKSKYESDYDYFYYKIKEDGYNTYYQKVRSFSQTSTYVGIPLEFRFTIRGNGRPTPYIRGGMVFNFHLTTATKTNLYRDDPGGDPVSLPDADKFVLPIYAAVGCHVGHKKSVSLEFTFPYILPGCSMSGFQECDDLGGGFRLTYQFAKNKIKE